MITVEALERIGGNRWQKNEMDRVYINDLAKWYGLEVQRYGTGNICGASLDGAHISNAEAGRILEALGATKFWWDVTTEKFMYRSSYNGTRFDMAAMIAAIKAAVIQAAEAELVTA